MCGRAGAGAQPAGLPVFSIQLNKVAIELNVVPPPPDPPGGAGRRRAAAGPPRGAGAGPRACLVHSSRVVSRRTFICQGVAPRPFFCMVATERTLTASNTPRFLLNSVYDYIPWYRYLFTSIPLSNIQSPLSHPAQSHKSARKRHPQYIRTVPTARRGIQWNSPELVSAPRGGSSGVLLNRSR